MADGDSRVYKTWAAEVKDPWLYGHPAEIDAALLVVLGNGRTWQEVPFWAFVELVAKPRLQRPVVDATGDGPQETDPNGDLHARVRRGLQPCGRCDGKGNERGDAGVGLGRCGMRDLGGLL